MSEAVLPAAVYLARKLGASVTLVHVIERNAPARVHGQPHLADPAAAKAYLAGIRQRFEGLSVEIHVHTDAISDVSKSIAEHAHEFASDLVLMSTHGRGGLRKLLFGSIAQQVVALRVPVLLVHPSETQPPPSPSGGPILVPLDGTEVREGALAAAVALSAACGSRLELLMVVPTLETLSGPENASRILLPSATQEALAFEQEDAADYLAQYVARLAARGISAQGEVRRGDPAEVIVSEAARLSVDFIVMGTHGKAGLDAFWSGSVAPKVSDRTHLPLLRVPG